MRRAGNGTVGSNPTLSAILPRPWGFAGLALPLRKAPSLRLGMGHDARQGLDVAAVRCDRRPVAPDAVAIALRAAFGWPVARRLPDRLHFAQQAG